MARKTMKAKRGTHKAMNLRAMIRRQSKKDVRKAIEAKDPEGLASAKLRLIANEVDAASDLVNRLAAEAMREIRALAAR